MAKITIKSYWRKQVVSKKLPGSTLRIKVRKLPSRVAGYRRTVK